MDFIPCKLQKKSKAGYRSNERKGRNAEKIYGGAVVYDGGYLKPRKRKLFPKTLHVENFHTCSKFKADTFAPIVYFPSIISM